LWLYFFPFLMLFATCRLERLYVVATLSVSFFCCLFKY
jgi:hypothetical protein